MDASRLRELRDGFLNPSTLKDGVLRPVGNFLKSMSSSPTSHEPTKPSYPTSIVSRPGKPALKVEVRDDAQSTRPSNPDDGSDPESPFEHIDKDSSSGRRHTRRTHGRESTKRYKTDPDADEVLWRDFEELVPPGAMDWAKDAKRSESESAGDGESTGESKEDGESREETELAKAQSTVASDARTGRRSLRRGDLHETKLANAQSRRR